MQELKNITRTQDAVKEGLHLESEDDRTRRSDLAEKVNSIFSPLS